MGSALGGVYVVVGAMAVLGNPMLRFLWVGVTLFLAFYGLSALSNYTVAARFAYLTVITIPLWDSRISPESKVESTLWAVGAITLGSVATLLMEIAFAGFRRTDQLSSAIFWNAWLAWKTCSRAWRMAIRCRCPPDRRWCG